MPNEVPSGINPANNPDHQPRSSHPTDSPLSPDHPIMQAWLEEHRRWNEGRPRPTPTPNPGQALSPDHPLVLKYVEELIHSARGERPPTRTVEIFNRDK